MRHLIRELAFSLAVHLMGVASGLTFALLALT